VHFLSRVQRNLSGYCREIIVTVPNAFALQNFLNAFRRVEKINSDHRFWFSPYTLAKIMHRSGFRPTTFDFVTTGELRPGGVRSWLRVQALRRYPSLRSTLVLRAGWA
jgi:hypothetical protein